MAKPKAPRKPLGHRHLAQLASPHRPFKTVDPGKTSNESLDQAKALNKTPAGNFSIFRELLKDGGKGEDAKWIFDLRTAKAMPKFEKYSRS